MEPEIIEDKIVKIIAYSMDNSPMLKVIKNNGDAKFGVYIQLGKIEGGGRALFTRALKISVYPLNEIADIEYVSKNMACYALNRSLVFEQNSNENQGGEKE
jgi:hypothetical protein